MKNIIKEPLIKMNDDEQRIKDSAECIVIIFFSIVAIIGIIGLIICPITPSEIRQHSGNAVVIDSAATSAINVSANSTLTADWNITLTFENNNKDDASMYYHDVRASLFYKADQFLANTTLASFYQSEGDGTVLDAMFSARVVLVDDWAADAIVSDLSHRGTIKFNVKLEALVTRNPGISTKTLGSTTVTCNDVKIKFSQEEEGLQGKLHGRPSKCLQQLKYIHEEISESKSNISN